MTDEVTAPEAVAAPPSPPAEAPAPASVTQVGAATPSEAPVSVAPAEGVATQTPAVEAPVATPAQESQPSLLEMAGKDAQPTPATVPEVAQPATVAPADAPRAPTFEAFKAPEGVSFEGGRFGEFQEVLGQNSVALAAAYKSGDPAQINKAAQDLGQKFLDLHMAEQADLRTQMQNDQVRAWNDTKRTWRDQVLNDPEIGGPNIEKSLRTIGSVIDTFAQEPAFNQRLRQAFSLTGAGENPDVVRFMHAVGKALGEGSPVPASSNAAPPQRQTRGERRYRANGASPAA